MDSVHMPVGCGAWPAFWTVPVGPNWPAGGEIDVFEGVDYNTYNQASLHTARLLPSGDDCTIPNDFGGTGVLITPTDCTSNATVNEGKYCDHPKLRLAMDDSD